MIHNMERVLQEKYEKKFLEGKLEGELKGKRDIAGRMLRQGMSITYIEGITGLSSEEIEVLSRKQ